MLIDGTKMKSARDRRALTQEGLAHHARVNVRTIQRAECGEPVRHETLADIAAALGVPPWGLLRPERVNDAEPEPDNEAAQTQVLKRVEKADAVIALLERATMAIIGCSAEPTEQNMPDLRAIIQTLEGLIGSPWNDENRLPKRFRSLLDKLETTACLNGQLLSLERVGLALYSAASTEFVKVPLWGEEGLYVHGSQCPEYITAARFMIADYDGERLRVSTDVVWPLDLQLDDDVPF